MIKKPVAYRISEEADEMVKSLSKGHGISQSVLIETLVRSFANKSYASQNVLLDSVSVLAMMRKK